MGIYTKALTLLIVLIGTTNSYSLILNEGEPAAGQMVVDFRVSADDSKSRWVVRALEQNFLRDLDIYPRIRPVAKSKVDTKACKQNLKCILKAYKEANVDVYLTGEGQGHRVDWQVYDTATGSKMDSGVLKTGPSASRRQLKLEAFRAVSHFIEKGGVFDQLAIQIESRKEDKLNQAIIPGQLWPWLDKAVTDNKHIVVLALIFLFVLCFLILIIKSLSWRKIQQSRVERDTVQRRLILEEKAREEEAQLPEAASEVFEQTEREAIHVEPYALLPLKALWVIPVLFLLTLITLVLTRPDFFGLTEMLTPLIDKSGIQGFIDSWLWLGPLPTGILWAILIMQLSRLITPSLAGFEQVHPAGVFSTLKSWFIVSLVRFLIVGAFVSPLIGLAWIGIRALDIPLDLVRNPIIPLVGLGLWVLLGLAFDLLSQYYDQEAVSGPVSKDNPWNHVLHRWLARWLEENDLPHDLERVNKIVFLPGQASDLVVYGGGFSAPRVVIHEKLLYRAFRNEKLRHKVDPEDLLQDLEPQAKDFLAGILLIALAQVHRRNYWIHCISFMIRKVRERSPNAISSSWGSLERLTWPQYSKNPTRLLDSYVCSHGCLDHLAQFLAFQLWRDSKHLTLTADRNQLRHETRKIIDRCHRDARFYNQPGQKILTERILWIGRFVESTADDITKNTAMGWKALLAISTAAIILIGVIVKQSYSYHPIYNERIAAKELELKEKAEKWRKKNSSKSQ